MHGKHVCTMRGCHLVRQTMQEMEIYPVALINWIRNKQSKSVKFVVFPVKNKNKLGHICTCVHAYIVNFYLDFHTCPFLEISRQQFLDFNLRNKVKKNKEENKFNIVQPKK